MIARREGDGWTLIRQMDHAAHCAELARAWRAGPHDELRNQLAKAPLEIRKTIYEASARRTA